MRLVPLSLLLLLLLQLSCSAGSAAASDAAVLLEFKKGIQDGPLHRIDSWILNQSDPTACPATWAGVSCTDGNVTAIVLDGLDLAGELKLNTLIGLSKLQTLSLSGNNFTGRIAPTFGSIYSLQRVDLSGNSFYGPIPAKISNMYNLNYLNLSSNGFQGGFPTEGIRNLQQLKVLDLHSNHLWGDMGELLSELRNVEVVDLSYNEFFGNVSIGVETVASLANTIQYLNLSNNRLSGPFFDAESINLFRNLKSLDLSGNGIAGELPSFAALPNFQVLRLGNNQLFGPIPEELFTTSIPLQELDLSGNGFTGQIPVINSTTMTTLNLSSNGLSGPLPSFMGKFILVDLSGNNINGDISTIQTWDAPLEFLDLSSNDLSGSLPNMSSLFTSLTTLRLSNNSLAGALPSLPGSLSTLDLSLNELDGTIPEGFFLSTLTYLNLSRNQITGPIPLQSSHAGELAVAMPSSQKMEYLDLSSNKLSGQLPSEVGNLVNLKLLNLARNSLTGPLPSELSKLTYLEHLDLSSNHFTGHVPDNLPPSLITLDLSKNNLSGEVPKTLREKFPSAFADNPSLQGGGSDNDTPLPKYDPNAHDGRSQGKGRNAKRIAIIVASVGVGMMILFALLAYYQFQHKEFHGSGFTANQATAGRDVKVGRSARSSLFKFQPRNTSLSFSNDHLLTTNSLSGQQSEFVTEISEQPEGVIPNLLDANPATSGRKSSPESPLSSSPRFIDVCDQSVRLDVYSPDRLAGELSFLDSSLTFTAEELSRAPAEVLGRSSHGTLYKATLDNGHMLTVKWLRVGLVKTKKEFAKEVKKIGSIKHPSIVPLRAYYWGPREQERLLLADYVHGDSLALHLYETTPRRHSRLSFQQRLKVAVEVAECLSYLHDKGLPHGNLKPTNVLLSGPENRAVLTDYGLHRLMTPSGIAEQFLNLGALGYRAPELSKPVPSFKADVYSFGVILMEILTRRSAGDIISGQSGAVDLTDWVRLCNQEGRGMDCIDRDIIAGGEEEEEHSKAMDELLAVSLRCILNVNERPNIRQVLDHLGSISV